jgi:hypothetical protein
MIYDQLVSSSAKYDARLDMAAGKNSDGLLHANFVSEKLADARGSGDVFPVAETTHDQWKDLHFSQVNSR